MSKVPQHSLSKRKDDALRRLKVTPEQLDAAPKITPILREIKGGIAIAFKAMRFSEDPLIKTFLEKYDSIPAYDRDWRRLSIEAVALSAGIDIRHLWGEIMLAMREHSVNAVKVIAVAGHPDVIRKRVEYAQTPGGFRDRDALDTMLGALPSPKTSTTFIGKFFAAAREVDDVKDDAPDMVDDLDFTFPDSSEMQERVAPLRKRLAESNGRE